MSRARLLDVNVLIALFHEHHVHHEPAHDWFADHHGEPWATCPLTENAFVRILSDPAQRSALLPLPTIAGHLERFCHGENHQFWPDRISMRDETLFNLSLVRGHRQLTDVYLLGLAVNHGGCLVTFDQSIPIAAVNGATPSSLEVIGGSE